MNLAASTEPTSSPALDRRPQRNIGIPFALTALFVAFVFTPRVSESPALVRTFIGVGAALLMWAVIVWFVAKRRAQSLHIDRVPAVRSHYVQGSVQTALYIYWGWFWRDVYAEASLFVAQLVFLYAVDALLAWTRGKSWRLGWGMLPIILSTNIFIWFRDDWYVWQFVMIAVSAFGKEFVRWNKGGRSAHIFNPSAFGLVVFSIALLVTGTTDHTRAVWIADTLAHTPQIFLVIFGLGLIVQSLFAVTLVTVSAALTLLGLGAIYTWITGTYFFVFWNISAPVFVGFHLLVTDPATSPRTNTGRLLFGMAYGVLTMAFYVMLDSAGLPTVYDKLLPIPILNLGVRFIERLTQRGVFGALHRWESGFAPRRSNAAYIAAWSALFCWMIATGYVQGAHEGQSIEFWKKAYAEGRLGAGKSLLLVVRTQARDGSAEAWNELGRITLDGELVPKDPAAAARFFSQASKLGSVAGSANLAAQFLSVEGAPAGKSVNAAFDQLEEACVAGTDPAFYALVARAYEIGRGRPLDMVRAHSFYEQGCAKSDLLSCEGVARTEKLAASPGVK